MTSCPNKLIGRRAAASCRTSAAVALLVLALADASAPKSVCADGTFAVMSYNVKGLPEIPFVIKDRTDQMYDIAEKLEDFHTAAGPYIGMVSIVGLQEVFGHDYYNILAFPQTVSYLHITDRDRRGSFNTGDGLTILSDLQIANLTRTRWEMCNGSINDNGSDCDTPKGYSFIEVTLEPGSTFHLYTFHADAGQGLEDQEARRSNIHQLIEAINERSPEGTAVIVLGDTNSRYTRVGTDNIQDLLTETGLHDVWLDLRRSGIAPEAGPSINENCDTTPSTGNCELVDKIFYRDGTRLAFTPRTYQVLRQMFMGTMKPLSDHDPVAVEFDYAIVTTTTMSTTTTTTPTITTTLGDRPCGDPLGDSSSDAGRAVEAGDALFVLRAAVGGIVCPLCTCDVDDSASVTATDALLILKASVGQTVPLNCPPCEGATTTTTADAANVAATAVADASLLSLTKEWTGNGSGLPHRRLRSWLRDGEPER